MEEDEKKRLDELDAKLDAIYASTEKTRKYILTVVWITVIMVALPAIGLVFVIPAFLNSYLGALDGLI